MQRQSSAEHKYQEMTTIESSKIPFLNLLNEFIKVDDQNRKELIKQDIIKYITNAVSDSKNNSGFHLTRPLFQHEQTKILQNKVLPCIEQCLLEKEKSNNMALRALFGLYSMQLQDHSIQPNEKTTQLQLKLIDIQKKIHLRNRDNDSLNHEMNNNLNKYLSKTNDKRVIKKASHLKEMIIHHIDSEKVCMRGLARRHYLPSVYDIFQKYKKNHFYGKPHIRRPLYLATKILLLSTHPEKAQIRYGLSKSVVSVMMTEARDILINWATKDVSQLGKNSETYQYYELAKWYLNAVDLAVGLTIRDPDAFILQIMMDENSSYDMSAIRLNVIAGISEALKIDKEWIQRKFNSHAVESEIKAIANKSKKINFSSIYPQISDAKTTLLFSLKQESKIASHKFLTPKEFKLSKNYQVQVSSFSFLGPNEVKHTAALSEDLEMQKLENYFGLESKTNKGQRRIISI